MPAALAGKDGSVRSDTIIVKGEGSNWSRPSSPEPMSPEIAPLVATLLAQIHQPLRLDSPEPSDDGAAEQETQLLAEQAQQMLGNAQKRDTLTSEDRLLLLPVKRELPWRLGVDHEAGIEKGGESRRKQIRYGCLLAARGDVAPVPCTSCANGRGKFSLCIALEGFFKGACAGCQLGGGPNRCSIKKDDEETPKKTVTEKTAHSYVDKSSPNITKKHRVDKPAVLRQAKRIRIDSATSQGDSVPLQRELKMRHPDIQAIHQSPTASSSWPGTSGAAPAPISAAVFGSLDRPGPHVQYLHARSSSSGYATNSNLRGPPSQPMSQQWAAVNQAQPTPYSLPQPHTPHNNIAVTENNSSGHPRIQQPQGRIELTVAEEDGSIPLIDTLPKSAQRQIYGIFSGLQGGIENLQRELNSFKRAFGIDEGH